MDTTFERRHALIPVDLERAQAVVCGVLRSRRVMACTRLEGGYCNSNYRLVLDGPPGDVVLRVISHEPERWRRQVRVMECASAHVRVPAVLHAAEGHDALQTPHMLLEWVEGVPLTERTPQAGRAVGETLAALGRVRFAATGLLGDELEVAQPFGSLADALRTFFRETARDGRAGARLGPALTDRLEAHIEDNIGYVETLPVCNALVHGDYNDKNLRMRTDGCEVAGVLDWDFAFSGPPLADLGNLLRYTEPRPYEAAVLEGFVAGGGELPTGWRRACRLLDLFAQLEFLNSVEMRPHRFDDALRLIRRMLDEWEQ